MTLKTSFKKGLSCLCAFLVFVFALFSSSLPVRAIDLPSTGSNTGDWGTSQLVSAGTSAIETAILTQYSSLDPTTLAILEAELSFSYALGQDVWAMQNGIEDFTINGSSYTVLPGLCRISVDGNVEVCGVTMTFSSSGFCCRSKHNVYALVRAGSGLSPAVDIQSIYRSAVYRLTSNPSNYFTFYSGSFFDNPTPQQSPYFTNSSTTFQWNNSGDPPLVNQSSWSYSSSSVSVYCQNILRTHLGTIPLDSSSDDVSLIMDDYKNTVASRLGITREEVDDVWTLPDEIPEDPTEPEGSGCCCQPFELPSEWVQSDVVELETDHYTIPYTDLVRNPYDYLVYGVTAPPPPVTPAEDAKKTLQTKTSTNSTRSGDPVKDLKDADPEMYEALFDYSALIQDILDRSGVLPYWAILMAAGALFLII